MYKIRFLIILVISIIMLCTGLTGCVMNENNAYSSPSNDRDSNDFNPYLKKIWVVKDWDGGSHNYHTSFFITEIENNVIKGKFSTGAVSNSCVYRPDELGNFSGTISNGIAHCVFIHDDGYSDDGGYKGKATLVFREKNVIEVEIEYAKRLNALNFRNGKYLYRPYNLADIADIDSLKKHSFPSLEFWGNVNFVTAVIDHNDKVENKIYPSAYLTNENDDILCDFSTGFDANTKIVDVVIEDINGNGLKDVKIITASYDYKAGLVLPDIPYTDWIFLQIDSVFYYEARGTFKQGAGSKQLPTPLTFNFNSSVPNTRHLHL